MKLDAQQSKCWKETAAKNNWSKNTPKQEKSNKRIIGWHEEDWDEPPAPYSQEPEDVPEDDVEVDEITEHDHHPIENAQPVTLEATRATVDALPPCIQISNATGLRRSRRATSQTQFFDPAANLNDTAIRAARAASNPLYEPQTEANIPDMEDLGDPTQSVLHVKSVTRLQHPGVAKELAAWRESMTIKQAKYQCRHFNPPHIPSRPSHLVGALIH